MNKFQKEIDELRAKERYNDEKIKRTIKEKEAIMGIHDDGEGQSIEPHD